MNDVVFKQLCIMKPEKYLLDKIKSYNDLISNFKLLKNCFGFEKTLKRILDIVVETSKRTKRFRRNDCFKLIKNQRKDVGEIKDQSIIDDIFYLFKKHINSIGDEGDNSLSVALKGLSLRSNQVDWLINNVSNDFVLNRVLRYPVISKVISSWALKEISNKKSSVIRDRKVELISKILDVNPNYYNDDTSSFVWSVYYSFIDQKIKKQIFAKLLRDKEPTAELVKAIAILGYIDILEDFYKG